MMKAALRTLTQANPILVACTLALSAEPGSAQCTPQWEPGFGQISLTEGIGASAVFDAGSGPALHFVYGTIPSGVWRWNGGDAVSVTSVANGPFDDDPFISAVLAFDDGGGSKLYVAGHFGFVGNWVNVGNIARWNGTAWETLPPLGNNYENHVSALCTFDDGSGGGSQLYAGGFFPIGPSGTTVNIARWNGTSWSAVGAGIQNGVTALAVYDDGSGPALYAGGTFTGACVLRWDGSSWTSLPGTGTPYNGVTALASFDDGSGPKLVAAGAFTAINAIPASQIASWNGSSWSALGSGLATPQYGAIRSLLPYSDGSGPKLYAAGSILSAGGSPAANVASWDGASWSALGSGTNAPVQSLCIYDAGQGAGPMVYAGGSFTTAGGVYTTNLARWNGSTWSRIAEGQGVVGAVKAYCVHDDGNGPALFACGDFEVAGYQPVHRVARWDGTSWSALGSGLGGYTYGASYYSHPANAMVSFDDGSGPALYVGGDFQTAGGATVRGIARWQNGSWSALGSGVGSESMIQALCVHDDGFGPALYAGGIFSSIGGLTTKGIARWDGSAWSAVGTGMTQNNYYDGVSALASWDDGLGGGPKLFAGGRFASASGVAGTPGLAAWDGTSWIALGGQYFGGANNAVYSLLPFDDGSGSKLYVGGYFTILGGFYCRGVGSWNGVHFWPVGAGFPTAAAAQGVFALAAFDDGAGQRLYAGGNMAPANGTTFNGLARWNGASWDALGNGLGSSYPLVSALAAFDDGSGAGSALYAGGTFDSAGGLPSVGIARWRSSCPGPLAYCFGDGSGTTCPCGNAGASGNGCATSFNSAGANLAASGIARVSQDSIVLASTGLSNSVVTFFQGTQRVNGGAGSLFGDGLRCAGGSTLRLSAVLAAGGAAQYPGVNDPSVSVRGQLPALGGTRTYQVWYRNAAAFCTPSTFNLSNGLEIAWAP